MTSVIFQKVGKVYPDGLRAVDDLNLEVAEGEFMVLVGPSGCGKTTALRMVAGLEDITEGEIVVGGTTINEIEPRRRDIAMVFQNYALYPHMTVFDNIAFPLRCRGVAKSEIRGQVEKTAGLLGLTDKLKQRPKTLSGGQRQRVAMGRAMVRQPRVFLMDEPLSNLDAKLRSQMRAEIATIQRDLGVTTIYVTHDQVEAMTMGTRIAVMRKGVLQQQGTPEEVFNTPANLFVASFIGSPVMNLFQARLERREGSIECVLGGGSQPLRLPDSVVSSYPRLGDYDGKVVAVGIRPDYLAPSDAPAAEMATIEGDATLVEILGADQLVHLEISAEPVLTDEILEVASDTDASVIDTLGSPSHQHRVSIVARTTARNRVEVGQPLRIGVDFEHLHFFDLETGSVLA